MKIEMGVIRTVKGKLDVADQRQDDLHQKMSQARGATCQLVLASGTVNLNGNIHTSDRVSAEREFTDKPHP